MDTGVLKEPRGFIRCIELLFAIIAFGTCANYSTTSTFQVNCTNGKNFNVTFDYAYPFR